ncbi:MAG TPA: S1 RNA-binding domain-containing protein, partial [Pseudomonadota bacterium]|nr:S1 RNA-binding domain-containing protein [Pseudomonadota bacterium]
HISDMSWTQRIKHPSEMFQKGDEVEAVVINIDTTDGEKPKISLGIKQLNPDPWNIIPDKYKVGSIVPAKVQKVLDFGAFVELDKGVEGLVHVSEISDDRVEDPRTVLKPGQEVNVEVISLDPQERKIGLSIKAANRAAAVSAAQGYGGSGELGAKLGDVLKKKGKKQRRKQDEDEEDEE